jgi:hypothetical protein
VNVVNQPIVKHKLGLLNLAQELGNVSQACKTWVYPETLSIATRKPKVQEVLKPFYRRIAGDPILKIE